MSKGIWMLMTTFLRLGKRFEVVRGSGEGDRGKKVSALSEVMSKGTWALSWMMIKG
jgi:hypothetical protein